MTRRLLSTGITWCGQSRSCWLTLLAQRTTMIAFRKHTWPSGCVGVPAFLS